MADGITKQRERSFDFDRDIKDNTFKSVQIRMKVETMLEVLKKKQDRTDFEKLSERFEQFSSIETI